MNRPLQIEKSDISSWIKPEEKAELLSDPAMARLVNLGARLESGSLSDEERRELEILTAEARAIDPEVLREA